MRSELNAAVICRRVLVVLPVAAAAGWLAVSSGFALSLLAGGGVALANLWFSAAGVERVAGEMLAADGAEEEQQNELAARKARGFQFAFLFRYILSGVVLFVLIRWQLVNIVGLVLGLSTVFATAAVLAGASAVHYLTHKKSREE